MKLPLILSFALAACAVQPARPPGIAPAVPVPLPVATPAERGGVDYAELQSSLGLNFATEDLGFREKPYNGCLPGARDCRAQFFVMMNLRLLCRPTEDTDSRILTADDLQPNAGREVTWHFKNLSGVARTDERGYFQIRVLSPASLRAERLRVVVGEDFLAMRAGEMGRLVTPRSWCAN